jgi:hypothetical protein
MRDYLFETNTQNEFDLTEKYNLSEYDRDYILHNYLPIIKVNNYDIETIKEKLNALKKEFIKENTIFDLEIFNRENIEYLIYELNQYIDVLKRGKVKMWNEYSDEIFYIFKMEYDIKENTLLISNKNITQLEIYFKSILNAFQDFTKEQNNIDKIKDRKKTNIDISKELNDFEVFNNDLRDETNALFNQNISKNEALNIYYKDYLPKYLTRINELISHLEQMQNEFKLYFPDLETDLQNLNTITSKFKKSILNDLETTLNAVLKIDYERLLFEYLNITNKLETDLKIEGKSISDFFVLFYNRMQHIKSNPKPPEATTEKKKSNFIQVLPKFSDVFFVHYQCEDFEKGTQIHNLSIYTDNKTIEYYKNTESDNIEHYCNKVIELCNKGLIPIHWGQNKTYYGSEHITDRYKELTGKTIVLEYTNSINLSEWLINTYGERYIAHPRLDNLAKLNEFNGITDKESRIFHTNRLFLLTKIYFNALNETLKTESNTLDLSSTSTVEKPSFTNEFDSVPESKVIEYFTKNLVENKHLTKETLTAYLKQAFELKTPPKQKYSFENIKTKEKIVSIFYKYYKETADKPHGKQQKYLDLLKIYFSGFEKINIRNFSK